MYDLLGENTGRNAQKREEEDVEPLDEYNPSIIENMHFYTTDQRRFTPPFSQMKHSHGNSSYNSKSPKKKNTTQALGYNQQNQQSPEPNKMEKINKVSDIQELRREISNENETLDVIFDPLLNCYYDPKSNNYYEIKK